MNKFKVKPYSDADRVRILGWAERQNQVVAENDGAVEFDFSDQDLRCQGVIRALKPLANFEFDK